VVLWFDHGDSTPRLRLPHSYSDEDASSSIIPKRRGGGRGRVFLGCRGEVGERWGMSKEMGMIEETKVIECDC
jgi:hypothetical protein